MANSWIFPSNNYGTVIGIGEASIETFKGSPYKSLSREICQNSMDARLDKNKPVVIEFSCFSIENREVPDYSTLKNSINSCLEFWTEQKNKKTMNFFKKAKKVIESKYINVLRISDYNTTGLLGSDKEYNTPWHNLVKAAGVSDKEGASGGSFGIGKAAPFACSDIRTLFYATKDINGLSAFQGIAKLVSFREKGLFKDRDSITAGTGYYSADRKNNPLRECRSIDPNYTRDDYGTDIFVLGFRDNEDWKSEIINSLLEDFLIAIFNNELVVVIDGMEINAKNLSEIIEQFKDMAPIAYNYYQVLTDERAVKIEHEFTGLGTIELQILLNQGLHRKVMMCRKNGMKIFDKANISGTIQFAGICVLKDEKINEYFRDMENPQHNAWEPERHSIDSKSKAKNNISMLYRFVKESVLDIGKKTSVDEIDAEGMGEYFADFEQMSTENSGKEEIISTHTSNIDINILKIDKEKMGYEAILNGGAEYPEEIDREEFVKDYGNTGSKDEYNDEKNVSHAGTGFGKGDGDALGTNGIGRNAFSANYGNLFDEDKVINIGTMSVRLFISDPIDSKYTLIFEPRKTAGNGYLQINLSGEQKNVKVSISNAIDILSNKILQCRENKIFIDNIEKNKKNKIIFQIEYAEECSLEVNLYGYQA